MIGYPKNNDNGPKYGQFYLEPKIRYHSVDFQLILIQDIHIYL